MVLNKQNITRGVFTVFLFSVINVLCKVVAQTGFNPLLFTSISLFFAGFFLICIGGPNYNSIKILRSPVTWLYGATSVSTVAIFIYLVTYITSTEAIMVMRLWIVIGLIISYVFFHRKTLLNGLWGVFLMSLGSIYVFKSINKEVLGVVIFLVVLISIVQSTQYFTLEHQKKYSKIKSDNLSVMGYILLSTSLLFLVFLIASSFLGKYVNYYSIITPKIEEVFDIRLFFIAPVFGILGFALLRTMEFKTVSKVGADIFMLFTALTPLFTLIVELLFSSVTKLIEPMNITPAFIISNILVVSGSFISAYGQIKKKEKKMAPKARQELEVIRDTIRTALICFNDDTKKVAQVLNIGERTIANILEKNKPVSKNLKEKIIYNHAHKVAGLDMLTGALNKTSLSIKLRDLKNKEKALIFFLDLNKFKPVNDTYGHKAGDSILEGVAQRLIEYFPQPHVVARLGGDEFVVIVYGKNAKEHEKYTLKIKEIIELPFIVEGIKDEISVGVSVGAAHYPSEGTNGEQLQAYADKRMYQDKTVNGGER